MQTSSVNATTEEKMESKAEGLSDSKLRTAMQFAKGNSRDGAKKSKWRKKLDLWSVQDNAGNGIRR